MSKKYTKRALVLALTLLLALAAFSSWLLPTMQPRPHRKNPPLVGQYRVMRKEHLTRKFGL